MSAAFDVVTENLTEELLTEHQNEIQKMKNYYDQHKELFEKVTRRQKLWREFLDLEVCILCEVILTATPRGLFRWRLAIMKCSIDVQLYLGLI